MKVALIVFNLINCSTVSYDDQSALINRQCPNFFSKAWVTRFSYDLANYDRSSLTHCIPEVTDKKCKRLGRLDNSIYVADCLIVVWDHPSYNGNLKVSTSMSSPSKCILTYRNRRFPNRLSNKAERFKNECLETTWGQWGEWTQINRKSRPSGLMTQSRRRRCDRSQVRSLPSRFRRLLPRYMVKCEKARKIEFRTVKVSKEKTHYSQWSQWSEWSSCSVTCGTGLSIKTRKCLSQKCIGMDQVSRDCKLETCPRVKVPSIIPTSNPCGNITKGCGQGECMQPFSGQHFCKCNENAQADQSGTCVTKPQEIDTDMPKSYNECDEWQFFIDGEPMSDSECREHVRQYLTN